MKSIAILAAALLAGCASTQMRQYVGQDFREVMLDAGPPINAIDLADGTRAFQYPFGGGTVAFPTVSTTTGSVSRSGWLDSSTISSGGGAANLPPCIISYITAWDPARKAWIVRDYRIPKQMFC